MTPKMYRCLIQIPNTSRLELRLKSATGSAGDVCGSTIEDAQSGWERTNGKIRRRNQRKLKNNDTYPSRGIGFVGLLTITFIVLKLTGVISWSWVWVLSPIWISELFFCVLLFVIVIIASIQKKKKNKKKE